MYVVGCYGAKPSKISLNWCKKELMCMVVTVAFILACCAFHLWVCECIHSPYS